MQSRLLMVLMVACMASFLNPFDGSVVNLALPTIGLAFNAAIGALIWLPTVYLLAVSSLQTSLGRLGDLKGRKRIFLLGLVIFTAGTTGAGLSTGIAMLTGIRVIEGIGAATMGAATTAIVVDSFPEKQRGQALGMTTMMVYLGQTVGPVVGGILVQTLGWRSIFFFNVPIGLTAMVLGAIYIPKDVGRKANVRFDLSGAVTLSAFIITLVLSLSSSSLNLSVSESLASLGASILFLVLFVLTETRFTRSPIMDLGLFTRNRAFTAGNATALFNYSTAAGTTLILSLYLQMVRGLSPLNAGLVLLAQPVVQVISTPIAGALSDRVEPRVLSSMGMLVKSIGLFMLAFVGTNSPEWMVWAPLLLVGLGHGTFSSPNTNAIMSSVRSNQLGLASGTLGSIRSIGQTVGIVVLSSIVAASMPPGAFSSLSNGGVIGNFGELFVLGTSRAFFFASGFCAVGIFTSLVRGKMRGQGLKNGSEPGRTESPSLEDGRM